MSLADSNIQFEKDLKSCFQLLSVQDTKNEIEFEFDMDQLQQYLKESSIQDDDIHNNTFQKFKEQPGQRFAIQVKLLNLLPNESTDFIASAIVEDILGGKETCIFEHGCIIGSPLYQSSYILENAYYQKNLNGDISLHLKENSKVSKLEHKNYCKQCNQEKITKSVNEIKNKKIKPQNYIEKSLYLIVGIFDNKNFICQKHGYTCQSQNIQVMNIDEEIYEFKSWGKWALYRFSLNQIILIKCKLKKSKDKYGQQKYLEKITIEWDKFKIKKHNNYSKFVIFQKERSKFANIDGTKQKYLK